MIPENWNYRVLSFEGAVQGSVSSDGDKETLYAVHEVFYDDDGKPVAYGALATVMDESMDGLKEVHQMIAEAFTKPVLDADTLEPLE